MTDSYLLEPDVGFIKEVSGLGGQDLKKCFQCATCAVACPISPDEKPFPRKEMIAASWGLKDRLVANHDIWLCHNCGDCTTLCPRGAKPGDVLAAVRAYTISEYATPKVLAKALSDPKKLPLLIAIPIILFIAVGLATGLLNFNPGGDEIVQAHFFSTWLVDMMMLPAAGFAVLVLALGLKRFLNDIHENAVRTGKTTKETLEVGGVIAALVKVVPRILKHEKFNECGENKSRATAHMMVLFAFIALFIVTNIFFVALYGLQIHGPYSQLNPVKWLANIGGIALVIGGILLIKNRIENKDSKSSYVDWYLLVLVLGLGLTGLGTEMARLAGIGGLSYGLYFVHLVMVWMLFAFLPFSKLAHLVYRTTAMAYAEWSGRT